MINYRKIEKQNTLLLTIGGSSASSSSDMISILARNVDNNKIFGVDGYASIFTSSRRIARYVREFKDINPKGKVILVGKSMGAWKLVRAARRLRKYGIDIDLFITVDISYFPTLHYQNYIKSEGRRGFVYIPDNVKKFTNYYENQTGQLQNGCIAKWEKNNNSIIYMYNCYIESHYNINVNDEFNIDVDHMNIDNSAVLLKAIKIRIKALCINQYELY